MAEKINLLFVGDVVGDPGIQILGQELHNIISKYKINLVVINGENADNGKGINEEIADNFFNLGADIITTGNHIWENWKSKPLLVNNDRILRPANYPIGNPGKGFKIFKSKSNISVAVVQIQGRSLMQPIDCPFRSIDNILKLIGTQANVVIVDFHAETSAEKITMAWHLDGRVSALLGTHTHIQTADASIFPKGMAYITDVGMTGPYDSVVGMRKDIALKRQLLQTAHKYEVATDDKKLSAVFVEIDSESGQAFKIVPIVYPKFITNIFDEL